MSNLIRDVYPLKGKKVMITGTSRQQGIGYAIARQCAAYGASIIIHHYQPHDKEQEWGADHLQDVIDGIKAEMIDGATFDEISGDFIAPEAPDLVMDEVVKNNDHIDALVCNHSLNGYDGLIGELTADMLDKHYAINTRSSILLAQAFARQHKGENRGNIIFMTSGQRLGPMGNIA